MRSLRRSGRRAIHAASLLLLALPLLLARPERLRAQELRGVAVLPDGTTPSVGGIIEAVLDSDPRVRVRALVGSGGRFVLRLPRDGRYRVAGLRVGYIATDLGVHDIAIGETKHLAVQLEGVVISLEAIRVETDSPCERVEGGGRPVAALLSQARLALQATLLSSPDGRAHATWRLERVITDRQGVALSNIWRTGVTSATDRPFSALPTDLLATEGFVRVRGTDISYRAPDAEALLSEQFVSSHCFRVTTSDTRPTEVGVSFVPAEDPPSDYVDVAGTLWLDRASAQLRRLEFNYVGLNREFEEAGAHGSVSFKRLDSGIWFVNRWWIRMPRASVELGERGPYLAVRAVELTGGQVESVRLGEDGATLFESHQPAEATLLPIHGDPATPPSCASGTEDLRDTPGLVYGMAFDTRNQPLAEGTIVASWTAPPISARRTTNVKHERLFSLRDGFFLICGLPLNRVIQFHAISGTQLSPTHSLRLRRSSTHEAIRLTIEDGK